MSGRSSCPECGTILRIRDRSFVGRRVNCPECKTALRIATEDQQGDYVARRLTPDELASGDHLGRGSAKAPRDKILLAESTRRSIIGRMLDSPLTAAWLLAIAISSLVAVLALAPKYRFAARPAPSVSTLDPLVEPLPNSNVHQSDPDESVKTETEIAPPVVPPADNHRASKTVPVLEPPNENDSFTVPPTNAVTGDVVPELSAETPILPVKIDVETKLMQELVSYKQTKPVRRRDLIEALQEQLGAPIRYDDDELGIPDLDKTITFELENTTVGGVIKRMTDAAGWEIHVEETGLRLTRK